MANSGREYEELVRDIQYSLFKAENIPSLKNINIEKNKKIKDRSGIEREFDIYWEFEIGGHTYRSVIECKDYSSPVSIEKIDAFIGKTNDIPGLKLIYATRTGYQSGAKIKAEQHNIQLLVIRDQQEQDWVDEDGTPLLKSIHFRMTAILPPRIVKFNVHVDKEWFYSQNEYTESTLPNLFKTEYSNAIFIHNLSKDERYSIHDLSSLLMKKVENMAYGENIYAEKIDNGYIENADSSIKM
ncbi:restriction endonuclease, partial [Escherichia coli]|nr:restriction endonuclease [Escherichia coli]ELK5413896.1 restriction endonuclease [Escherichia coli]MED8954704.1 restriction endonuclease [Escherichia coli]